MSEAMVVNAFLWVRVFLVGGIFILFPRITRKGLLFGVYVGEEFSEGKAARELLRGWDRGCGMVMASALLVGLIGTLAGNAVAGNLTGTAVLLLGVTGLYVRWYGKVKALPRPDVAQQAARATAPIQTGTPGGETVAKATLVICLVVALSTIIYGLVSFPGMNERMPSLWGFISGKDAMLEKSLVAVLYAPSWNLVVGPLFALLALMIATAKRSLREGPGGRSAEAQDAFRAVTANLFSGTALLYCILLTYFSVQVIRSGMGEISSIGPGILWIIGPMLVFMAGGLFFLLRRYGQGGALMEKNGVTGALTGGLADNAHWVGGVFYINREDPSLMVESRFGLGYSTNWGNRTAVAFTVFFLTLILALILVGIFAL